jgi:hypothetical protein
MEYCSSIIKKLKEEPCHNISKYGMKEMCRLILEFKASFPYYFNKESAMEIQFEWMMDILSQEKSVY